MEIKDTILVAGKIDTVYKAPNGEIVIVSENGETTRQVITENTLIMDDEGNRYVVDEKGEIKDLNSQTNEIANSEESRSIITPVNKFYITANMDTARYYQNNENIYLSQTVGGQFEFTVKYPENVDYSYTGVWNPLSKSSMNLKTLLTTYNLNISNFQRWYKNNHLVSRDSIFKFSLETCGVFNIKAVINDSLVSGKTYIPPMQDTTICTIKFNDSTSINVHVVPTPIVTFERGHNYDGSYGFDYYEYERFKNSFDTIKLSNSTYYVPWMSMWNGSSKNIIANIQIPVLYRKLKVKFISTKPEKVNITQNAELSYNQLKQGLNSFDIQLNTTDDISYHDTCQIYATDENNKKIGRLSIEYDVLPELDNIPLKATLIFVKTDTSKQRNIIDKNKVETDVTSFLNNYSYNQALLQWNINVDTFTYLNSTLNKLAYNNQLDSIQSFNIYDSLRLSYSKNIPLKPNHSYVFVTDRLSSTIPGIGNVPTNINSIMKSPYFVIMFYNAVTNNTTYAHELGHNRSLKHPFQYRTNLIPKQSSQNFMDYSTDRIMFFKEQCQTLYWNQIERP